jgi:hypothetical protein
MRHEPITTTTIPAPPLGFPVVLQLGLGVVAVGVLFGLPPCASSPPPRRNGAVGSGPVGREGTRPLPSVVRPPPPLTGPSAASPIGERRGRAGRERVAVPALACAPITLGRQADSGAPVTLTAERLERHVFVSG